MGSNEKKLGRGTASSTRELICLNYVLINLTRKIDIKKRQEYTI